MNGFCICRRENSFGIHAQQRISIIDTSCKAREIRYMFCVTFTHVGVFQKL